MKRETLIKSKGYNVTKIQNELFRLVEEYLKENNKNRSQFAKELKVTKGYVSQVLNCNFDFKLSKLVELSLAIGRIPEIQFVKFDELSKKEMHSQNFKVIHLNERRFENQPTEVDPKKILYNELGSSNFIYKIAE